MAYARNPVSEVVPEVILASHETIIRTLRPAPGSIPSTICPAATTGSGGRSAVAAAAMEVVDNIKGAGPGVRPGMVPTPAGNGYCSFPLYMPDLSVRPAAVRARVRNVSADSHERRDESQ
jgi:hypothetical protein